MTDTDNGKWEEMVNAGAADLRNSIEETLGVQLTEVESIVIASTALQAAGVKKLVSIRDTLVEAAMPDHPKPGQFSWQLSKLREAYDAALSALPTGEAQS